MYPWTLCNNTTLPELRFFEPYYMILCLVYSLHYVQLLLYGLLPTAFMLTIRNHQAHDWPEQSPYMNCGPPSTPRS